MKYLIAITTCKRLNEVRKNIAPYLKYCIENEQFDFVLSLDGEEEEYSQFCEQFKIPLIWSQEREGVGISKNRVCKLYPDYDGYFFIEDDVVLYDSRIFRLLLELSSQLKIHHFSRTHTIGILKKEKIKNTYIIHSSYGSGAFLFYTRQALDLVGGWHSAFAKHKRFGHTEHTYRVYQNNMNPSPFVFPRKAEKMIIVDSPPSVSRLHNVHFNENGLIDEEQEMIKLGLINIPFETFSQIKKNTYAHQLADKRYVLPASNFFEINKQEKRKALSLLYFHKFKVSGNPMMLFISFIYDRKQIQFKNYIMIRWITWKMKRRKQ
jgi:hypothetical protein